MHIYYRVSNNSYSKEKLKFATKEYCLENFLSVFDVDKENLNILADNVTDERLMVYLGGIVGATIEFTYLNNAQSFRYILEKALKLPKGEIVYFVEDDYLHLKSSPECIIEGLDYADYITLYDAPDKYINYDNGGHNPFISEGGESTRVMLTKNRHWKLTNSTTMTFAAKAETLKQDYSVWIKYLASNHPYDFQAFLELRQRGRKIASPLPSLSTHCELGGLAPLVDWKSLIGLTKK